MSFLLDILAHKRSEVAQQRAVHPLVQVRAAAEAAPPPLDFVGALRGAPSRPALIAEIKRQSPSRGLLARDLDPLRLAQIYRENGAACISVLTDEHYFGGSLDQLSLLAGRSPRVPLLRKDFLCDPYQVYQARAAGADAVLLIVALLPPDLLRELYALTRSLRMAALVEVRSEAELEAALSCGPALVGINNRNLHDFSVDLGATERLAGRIPPEVCLVAESGIREPEDVARVAAVLRPGGESGVDAILVGEALVTARDVAAKARELTGAPLPVAHFDARAGTGKCTVYKYTVYKGEMKLPLPAQVKICGITVLEDALAAIEAGADLLGFNFHPPSPRYVGRAICARLVGALRDRGLAVVTVGIFVDMPPADILAMLDECGLDLAQLSGDESPDDLAVLGERAFKGIRPRDSREALALAALYACRAAPPVLLADASVGAGQFGGTGRVADWDAARALTVRHSILLAGGLRPENVADAVAAVHPWGVDVASGVESSPGRKDAAKMVAFLRAARGS